MIRQTITLPLREDAAGSGRWHAPRDGGARLHEGIDRVCTPGQPVLSPVYGTVSKHGIVYGDDHRWRYIEIKCSAGLRHRLFYLEPGPRVGARVTPSTEVGLAQDIREKYPELPAMQAHIHYGVLDPAGRKLNPEDLANA